MNKELTLYKDKVKMNIKKYYKLRDIANMSNDDDHLQMILTEINRLITENDHLLEKQRNILNDTNTFEVSLLSTLNGDIEYNENHPYYMNETFHKTLLSQYIYEERYEKCISLV